MHYYISVIRDNYANFEGRARRAEYWNFFLYNFLISLVIGVLTSGFSLEGMAEPSLLSSLYSLAVLVPGLAVGVRRLHDTNRSGWWLLILFVPLVGIFVLLYFLVSEGTQGPNQYGTDPKNPDSHYLEDHLVE